MGDAVIHSNVKLGYDPDRMVVIKLASLLPATDEYSTLINLFPGINAHPPWGTHGVFFLSITLFSHGNEVGKIHSGLVSEGGNIRVDFDDLTHLFGSPEYGLCIMDLHRASDIPVDLYLAHVHRRTGVYVAYPALAYVGSQLYPTVHTDQLENTLFWPGLLVAPNMQACVAVMNPYSVPMGFQIHLYLPDGRREQTELMRLRPYSAGVFPLEELFFGLSRLIGSEGRSSVCVSAQYKVIAYIMMREAGTGIITMLDHLHNYCLY